jgi:hypothetical protein
LPETLLNRRKTDSSEKESNWKKVKKKKNNGLCAMCAVVMSWREETSHDK